MNTVCILRQEEKRTGIPLLQDMPAPVTTRARLLFAMKEARSVIKGSVTSVGSEMAIFTFIGKIGIKGAYKKERRRERGTRTEIEIVYK